MSRDLDAVKRKIRSLLEVAKTTSGATEPERLTAKRLADKIMLENDLREWEVPERQVQRAMPPPPPVHAPIFVSPFGYVHFTVNQDGSCGFDFQTGTTTSF